MRRHSYIPTPGPGYAPVIIPELSKFYNDACAKASRERIAREAYLLAHHYGFSIARMREAGIRVSADEPRRERRVSALALRIAARHGR